VAIVAESFLPHVNGVTNSVLRILEHLRLRGHQALVLAPSSSQDGQDERVRGYQVRRMRSIPLPGYPQVRLNMVTDDLLFAHLVDFKPDVIHLASPFLVGPPAVRAAKQLGVPIVAVFQTDVPAFTSRYNLPFAQRLSWNRLRAIHCACYVNLVPSTASRDLLRGEGIDSLRIWPRGVDLGLFHPRRRSSRLRRDLGAKVLIGAVGRLAPEKSWEDLEVLSDIPDTRLVFIGDGPRRRSLEKRFPGAAFLGFRQDTDLAEAVASMDICVNPGVHETFCQSVQEALSCGVPVVAAGAGGPLDLISSSRTGWLYTPGNQVELRARVVDLVGDQIKRRAMGLAARESVVHRTWSTVGDVLLDVYSEVLQMRGVATPGPTPAMEAS